MTYNNFYYTFTSYGWFYCHNNKTKSLEQLIKFTSFASNIQVFSLFITVKKKNKIETLV